MIRKPLCNHVHTSENSLARYRSYKTDLPLSRLSFWSITFVGSIKHSKWPEKENFHLKLDSLFLFLEMKAIPCEKLLRNWRFPTTVCTTPFRGQHKQALTRVEKEVGGRVAQLSKKISALESGPAPEPHCRTGSSVTWGGTNPTCCNNLYWPVDGANAQQICHFNWNSLSIWFWECYFFSRHRRVLKIGI